MKATKYAELRYKHPAEIDADPPKVGGRAIDALGDASLMYARHVEAVARQVRSSYLSKLLRQKPSLSPEKLAAAWEASPEAAECVRLIRSVKIARTCVKRLGNLMRSSADQGGESS